MKISGPHFDQARKSAKKSWWLSYSVPKIGPDGAAVIGENGRAVLERKRPYYETQADAIADKPRIAAQYGTGGAGAFVQSREAMAEYEAARRVLPAGVSLVQVAEYWRRHHPAGEAMTLGVARERFIANRKLLLGEDKQRHVQDLSWRTKAFVDTRAERVPASVARKEILDYLLALDCEPRGKLNHKRAIRTFFGWLLDEGVIDANPAAGISKKKLPRVLKKEVEFLTLEETAAYLRAAERYDPELVAHEIVQLFAGVRSDDEMGNFRGEWVKVATRVVVMPAEITKTGVRDVIGELEENFWAWWKAYGRDGILRPASYRKRWKRIRLLATVQDLAEADRLAALSLTRIQKEPALAAAMRAWPWNARRRTFCTFHVAKYQSADKTALILRHHGAAETLHNSYRGLDVTQAQGAKYFGIMPAKVAAPVQAKAAAPGHGGKRKGGKR